MIAMEKYVEDYMEGMKKLLSQDERYRQLGRTTALLKMADNLPVSITGGEDVLFLTRNKGATEHARFMLKDMDRSHVVPIHSFVYIAGSNCKVVVDISVFEWLFLVMYDEIKRLENLAPR